MITKPIRFVQIAVNTDHIFGLTPEGDVYYRDKPAWSFNSNTNAAFGQQKKEETEEKKVWKKCTMEARVEVPKGGAEREAQVAEAAKPAEPVAEVVLDEPPHRVYKDVQTVKHVQTALKAKGFYKENNKIDGDLGNITMNSIKAFQKSLNLKETGEIDVALWNALGLGNDENEIVVNDDVPFANVVENVVEDINENFISL